MSAEPNRPQAVSIKARILAIRRAAAELPLEETCALANRILQRIAPICSGKNSISLDDHDSFPGPASFLCPITRDVMRDPWMIVETGHSYERCAIIHWLVTNPTDPMTNQPLRCKGIMSNHALRNAIGEYCKLNKCKLESSDSCEITDRRFFIRIWSDEEVS